MATENGNARMKLNVGVIFYLGYGVPKDYNEAFKLIYQAATEGRTMVTRYNLYHKEDYFNPIIA